MNINQRALFTAYAVDTTSNGEWATPTYGAVRLMPHPGLGFPLGPFGLGYTVFNGEMGEVEVQWYPRNPSGQPVEINEGIIGILKLPPYLEGRVPMIAVYGEGDIDVTVASTRYLGGPTLAARTGFFGGSEPTRLGAPSIKAIRLSPQAEGARVVSVRVPYFDWWDNEIYPQRPLGLPVGKIGDPDGFITYLGYDDGGGEGIQRAANGAPFTRPPHITAAFGSGIPAPTPSDEEYRIRTLASPYLEEILHDRLQLRRTDQFAAKEYDQDNRLGYSHTSNVKANTMNALWAASCDPGVARWLGLMDDFTPLDSEQPTVVRAGGVWVLDASNPLAPLALASSKPNEVIHLLNQNGLSDVVSLAFELEQTLPNAVVAWLLAEAYAPPVRDGYEYPETPPPPALTSRGNTWGLEDTEDVCRVSVKVGNLRPIASLGVVRSHNGIGPVPTQPLISGLDYAVQPLIFKSDSDFVDPLAEPVAGVSEYGMWQTDMFGRWSESANQLVKIKRPDLPIPQPMVQFLPDLGPHSSAGLYRAPLSITVPVPERIPGQIEIEDLEMTFTWDQTLVVPIAAGPGSVVLPPQSGPPTTPASVVEGTIKARFRGVDGSTGAWNDYELEFTDPRPPVPPDIPPVLRFANRDDASGQAAVSIRLPTGSGIDGYHIYITSETRLRSVAGAPGGADRDARAQVWKTMIEQGRLTRDKFDLVAPITYKPGTVFIHQLPGTLEEITFFRLVPMNKAGAEASFAACPTLQYAVPRTLRPVAPAIWAERNGDRTLVHVESFPGSTQATNWRIRALKARSEDLRLAVVIGSGTLDDEGKAVFEPPSMRLFASVALTAEVQGKAERGVASQEGLWSLPSRTIEVMNVPDREQIDSIITVAFGSVNDGVLSIFPSFDPETLPVPFADFKLRLYEAGYGESPRFLHTYPLSNNLTTTWDQFANYSYYVQLVDPIGREAKEMIKVTVL